MTRDNINQGKFMDDNKNTSEKTTSKNTASEKMAIKKLAIQKMASKKVQNKTPDEYGGGKQSHHTPTTYPQNNKQALAGKLRSNLLRRKQGK
jgi:hypothetical protein